MSKLLWFFIFIVIAGCSVNTLFTTEKFTFYENDIKVIIEYNYLKAHII